MSCVNSPGDNQLTAQLVQRFGGSASVALLDPACQFFSLPHIEGLIGYRVKGKCAVVYGDPVCSEEDIPTLVHAFHQHCHSQKKSVVYTAASKPFAGWAINNVCGVSIEVTEELIVNPQLDVLKGAQGRKLRTKVSQSHRAGTKVHEYVDYNESLERQIEEAAWLWLQGRRGPQIYLADVHLFSTRSGKRWFYAIKDELIVGVLLLNELKARKGWVLNLSMVTPEAPHGTSELLVVKVIQFLKEEGCHFLTVGIVASAELGEIVGLGNVSAWVARKAFKAATRIFSLQGKNQYWKKFQPKQEHTYVLIGPQNLRPREVLGILRALNVGI